MKLLSLSLRNLLRNGRRTLITVSAIATGLAMMLFTITLQSGTYHDLLKKGVSSLAGHVVVQHPGYQEEREEEMLVTEASAVAETLQTAFPDATVASRMFLGGLLMSPSNSVGAALSAVEPEPEAQVGYLDDKLVEGEWLTDEKGIILGVGMAESLGVEVGDKLVYMGQHGGSESTSKLFRVRGIFRTGAPEMDGFIAVIHLGAARKLFEQEDVAHQVTLHLPNAANSAAAAATVSTELEARDDLAVLDWPEAVPELVGFVKMDRAGGDVMFAIIGIIVAMGVLNTVLMSVLERTREFGVLLAIGLKPRQLAVCVLLEGLFLGVIGAAAGVALGIAFSYPIVANGIDMAAMMGGSDALDMGGVPMDTLVYGVWNLQRSGIYVGTAILFTTFAAIYPAITVSRLDPVEAMRHV